MSGRRRWLAAGTVAVLAGGTGAWFASRRYDTVASDSNAGRLFFEQTLADAEGTPIAMGRHRDRVLVINFWATWCPPCIEEMPELAQLAGEWPGRPVEVVGIGIDSPSNIREFSRKTPYPYPLYAASSVGPELARLFGNQVGGLPFTVVLDRRGQVTFRVLGRFNLQKLRTAVGSALAA